MAFNCWSACNTIGPVEPKSACKNVNNYLASHFEPQHIDVFVSYISIQGLDNLSVFAQTYPLSFFCVFLISLILMPS